MITLDATALARADSTVRGAVHLIELDFLSGMQRFAEWPVTLSSGGFTWIGAGDVAGISNVSESEDTKADKLTLSISIVNSAMLAATIGSPTEYRNRDIRIYMQFMDDLFQPAGAFALAWYGKMDKISVVRKKAELDGEPIGSIDIECTRVGLSRLRNDEGLRLTHEQQQIRFPGDNGLEYINTLVNKPAQWLSRAWQQV